MFMHVLEYLEKTAQTAEPGKVMDEFQEMTYPQLLRISRKVGSGLSDKNILNQPVAVLLEKSVDALSAFFGILYAGGFYTLFNPELPKERLSQMQSVLQAPFVITDETHQALALTIFEKDKVLLIHDLQQAESAPKRLQEIRAQHIDTSPLYINFTSGSTGTPKGVVISHKSVLDFIDVFTEEFSITQKDVIGNQAPLDFDVSVKDIYSAIKTGADLVLIPKHLFSSPAKLLDFICEHEITTMIWAVSALCLISTFHGLDYRIPQSVNKVLFSGEVMPLKHLKTWMEHLPHAEFINVYGPTEITCNCTYHRVERGKAYADGIPIGKAFKNERVFLLDEADRLIREAGKPGEICVGGTAVGLGYYNAWAQSSEKFTQNPLHNRYFDRIYRTGDLGKYDENGNLYFSGRKDFQIKYKGHRIELEEIEKAMSEASGVERACCVFDEEKGALYGFYIGNAERKALHLELKAHLPVFMIPGKLVQKEAFPLTKNGKTDRKALKQEIGGK